MREADALIQLETLEIKILKNWKAKKWMTTSPFFEREKNQILNLKNWKFVDLNLKNWKICRLKFENLENLRGKLEKL